MGEDHGVWVYAVTGLPGPQDLASVTGVGGEPVRVVGSAGLAAVVGTVRLAEFGEEPLRRKLNDLDVLAAMARAHHSVVAFTARGAPTVPMRLATVYHDDARVAAMLEERHDAFVGALEQIAGRTEWGVKVYAANPSSAARPEAGAGQEAGARPEAGAPQDAGARQEASGRPGTAYLLARKAQLSSVDTAREAAAESAQAIHQTLSAMAVAARRHAPQDSQLSGQAGWMVLNGAYLVDDAASESFAAEVRNLSNRYTSVRLELTGPWPPYSFSVLSGEEPA